MTFETEGPDGYRISDDPARFDLARGHGWISGESYWAPGIPLETFRRSVENSLTFAVYASDGTMAAMGRVVTDRATFGWLCDVFVDQGNRGRGLGKALVEYFLAHPELQGLRRRHLATADGHDLYRQYGFTDLTGFDRFMEILDRKVYSRG